MKIDQSSAWAHALALYRHQEIADTCLRLQDEFDCNVNLILFCHYLDAKGHLFAHEEFALIKNAILNSEQELKNHRQLRRSAKTENPDNYASFLADELVLEKDQHTIIVDCANTLLDSDAHGRKMHSLDASASSLMNYMQQHCFNPQQAMQYCDIINKRQ